MPKEKTKNKKPTAKEKYIRELVKTRMSVMPSNVNISVGSEGSFNKDEILEHIDAGDEIGQKIVQIDMEFLQSLKSGELYDYGNTDNKA